MGDGQHASNPKTYPQTVPRPDYFRNADDPGVNWQTRFKMWPLLKICSNYRQFPYRRMAALPITPDSLRSGGHAAFAVSWGMVRRREKVVWVLGSCSKHAEGESLQI
jgi:hypothetical protein